MPLFIDNIIVCTNWKFKREISKIPNQLTIFFRMKLNGQEFRQVSPEYVHKPDFKSDSYCISHTLEYD